MRMLPLLSLLTAVSCTQMPTRTPESAPKTTDQSHTYAVQLSSRLNASAQSDLDQRLQAAFVDGVAHPTGVQNCAAMLALGSRGAGSTADRNYAEQRSTFIECSVYQELRHATPASSSFVADLKWDQGILSLLPPQLAISVSKEDTHAVETAAAAGNTWPVMDKTVTATVDGPDRVMVRGDGFIVRLILWGRGDFNSDGVQDLLVQTLDTLTQGTYRNTRLFILSRRSGDGPLSVVKELQ